MKIFYTYILAIISAAVFINSCCDCEECLIQNPDPACAVKNNALIEFKAGVIDTTVTGSQGQDSTYFKPVANFAAETFEFPSTNNSSGSQPSDQRFASSAFRVAQAFYDSQLGDEILTAVIFGLIPPNKEIKGDILVVGVNIDANPLNSTAHLRIYGDIARYSEDFPSENSGDFCDKFIPENTNLESLRENSSRHGRELRNDQGDLLTGQIITDTYNDGDITVLDSEGNEVVNPIIPDETKNDILFEANRKSQVDILVRPGEVYYIKARNGREFAMQITGITQGIFPNDPVKKNRVYVMFTPI